MCFVLGIDRGHKTISHSNKDSSWVTSQTNLHYYITRGVAVFRPGSTARVFLDRRWRVIVLYEKDFLLLYYIDPVRARSLPARCRLPGEHLSLQRDTSQTISYRATFLVLYHAPRYRALFRHDFTSTLFGCLYANARVQENSVNKARHYRAGGFPHSYRVRNLFSCNFFTTWENRVTREVKYKNNTLGPLSL